MNWILRETYHWVVIVSKLPRNQELAQDILKKTGTTVDVDLYPEYALVYFKSEKDAADYIKYFSESERGLYLTMEWANPKMIRVKTPMNPPPAISLHALSELQLEILAVERSLVVMKQKIHNIGMSALQAPLLPPLLPMPRVNPSDDTSSIASGQQNFNSNKSVDKRPNQTRHSVGSKPASEFSPNLNDWPQLAPKNHANQSKNGGKLYNGPSKSNTNSEQNKPVDLLGGVKAIPQCSLPNHFVNVCVVHAMNPYEGFVVLRDHLPILTEMSDEFNKNINTYHTINFPKLGLTAIGNYDSQWNRCWIQKSKPLTVKFIDYGFTKIMDGPLKKLPAKYYSQPSLAIHILLNDGSGVKLTTGDELTVKAVLTDNGVTVVNVQDGFESRDKPNVAALRALYQHRLDANMVNSSSSSDLGSNASKHFNDGENVSIFHFMPQTNIGLFVRRLDVMQQVQTLIKQAPKKPLAAPPQVKDMVLLPWTNDNHVRALIKEVGDETAHVYLPDELRFDEESLKRLFVAPSELYDIPAYSKRVKLTGLENTLFDQEPLSKILHAHINDGTVFKVVGETDFKDALTLMCVKSGKTLNEQLCEARRKTEANGSKSVREGKNERTRDDTNERAQEKNAERTRNDTNERVREGKNERLNVEKTERLNTERTKDEDETKTLNYVPPKVSLGPLEITVADLQKETVTICAIDVAQNNPHLQTDIDNCVVKSGKEFTPEINHLCLAKFDGEYYRGLCKCVNDDKMEIFFIDYGNTAWVPVTDGRVISKELKEMPALGIMCHLKGDLPNDWDKKIDVLGDTYNVDILSVNDDLTCDITFPF